MAVALGMAMAFPVRICGAPVVGLHASWLG
jgi:hypothetical protein